VRGEQRAESLCFESEGQVQDIQASLVLLHQGVVPDTQISRLLHAEHDWNEEQLCWVARRDRWGETSLPGIFIAGDGATIGGANVARTQGHLAALCIAHRLRRIDDLQLRSLAEPWLQMLRRQRAPRPLIDALYRPQSQNRIPDDETIVCRCEEVSAGTIRDAVKLGCLGPDQTKAFSRCGMGPCQGRQCGLSVIEIIARQGGVVPAQVGYYRVRPPLKPITLAQLASEREFDMSVFPHLERSRHEHRPNWYRK
jgi:bacterioferritin-associated ferredoxin